MGATFLMSYPSPGWHVRGGANFRSQSRAATNPRAAFKEWLTLADAITRAGGRILVMAPPRDRPELTGLTFTANLGALFKDGDAWRFLVAKMAAQHRQGEPEVVKAFLDQAGLPSQPAAHPWEGQADVIALRSARYIITWGVRSARESLAEVRKLLPRGARALDVQLREPWFHGDTCFASIATRSGDQYLLAFEGALVDHRLPEIRTFLGPAAEVIPVDEEDARAYACNSLAVNGTLFMPEGTSAGLRGQLIRRGFTIEEVALPELCEKGGGGPRCLVNELTGFVLTDEAPSYSLLRDQLLELCDSYPESASAPGQEAV
jgi:N-dimethylarginine dimethylaminohydrolase